MAALLDYYLDAAERNEVCWNLDGTLWDEDKIARTFIQEYLVV